MFIHDHDTRILKVELRKEKKNGRHGLLQELITHNATDAETTFFHDHSLYEI